jgi:hypothetical protein
MRRKVSYIGIRNTSTSQFLNIPFSILATMSFITPYQELETKSQAAVLDSIPAKWKLSPETSSPEGPRNANVIDIPTTCGILISAQIDITENNLTELVEKLATGKLSSVGVTEAFWCKTSNCTSTRKWILKGFHIERIIIISAETPLDELPNVFLLRRRTLHGSCLG